jgi:galactose-1-phosphate uridylyltransferase
VTSQSNDKRIADAARHYISTWRAYETAEDHATQARNQAERSAHRIRTQTAWNTTEQAELALRELVEQEAAEHLTD